MHYPGEMIEATNAELSAALQEMQDARIVDAFEARRKFSDILGRNAFILLLHIQGLPSQQHVYAGVESNGRRLDPITDKQEYPGEAPVTLERASMINGSYRGLFEFAAWDRGRAFNPDEYAIGTPIAYTFDALNLSEVRLSDDVVPFERDVEPSPLEITRPS